MSKGFDEGVLELEWKLIYALVVAGKSAKFANRAISDLRRQVPGSIFPISYLADCVQGARDLPTMRCPFQIARTGRYRVLRDAVVTLEERISHGLDLRTCTPEDLEAIPGVGPKTSRFFIAWTRATARVAVLDRHVLRWLKKEGYVGVPRNTPTGWMYLHWEAVFLREAEQRGKTPRELDLEIWSAAATAPNVVAFEEVNS